MAALNRTDVQIMIVVRRRPGVATRPTSAFPAMPAMENSEAITPESQMAFLP